MEYMIPFIYSISAFYFFYEALQCYDYMESMKNKSIYLKNSYKQTLLLIEEMRRYPSPSQFDELFKTTYIQKMGNIFYYFQKIENENFQEVLTYHPENIQFLTEEYIVLLRIIDHMIRHSPVSDVNMTKLKEKMNDYFIFHQRYIQDYVNEQPCFYITLFGVWNILLHIIISVFCTIMLLF